ncbi:MAG: DUF4169 family protein [Parafilimonas terrae]|nr:DUF4169 family protein [Parafilimonas terrae]
MGEVVNLRLARKRVRRAAADTEAARRRASFGRAKGERTTTEHERDRAEHALDQHRRETDASGDDGR